MAIRIRKSGNLTIALCAAETDPLPGDAYLDDAQHYALAAKFAGDWEGQDARPQYIEEWAEMAKHKLCDAETELNKWLAASGTETRQGGDEVPSRSDDGPTGEAGDAQGPTQ